MKNFWHIFSLIILTLVIHNSFILYIWLCVSHIRFFPSYAKQTTWHPFIYVFFFFSIKLHMTHNKKLKNVYNIWCNITYSYLSSYCFQVCRTYRKVDTSPDILKFSYFRHHLHVWKKLYLLTLIFFFFLFFSYLYNMKTHHHIQFTFLSTSAKFYILNKILL